MKRTERLFALAEHLRARRTGVTAETLAERFEVTVRTIYRDLDSLRAAELPLVADRGRGGGYALDRSYSLPPVNFSAREAALLVAAGRMLLDLRLTPFTEGLSRALDKVHAALPARTQREVSELARLVTHVGVPARAAAQDVRAAVEEAWFERRPLTIRYAGAGGTTTRVVRLESVVMDRAETLLNCHDVAKGEPRQFKLHLVEHAVVLREPDVTPAAAPAPARPALARSSKTARGKRS